MLFSYYETTPGIPNHYNPHLPSIFYDTLLGKVHSKRYVLVGSDLYKVTLAVIALYQMVLTVFCSFRETKYRMGVSGLTIKGTVSRDFLLLVFFMNQFPPSPRVSH